MKKRLFSTFMALLMVCSLVMYLPAIEIKANADGNIIIAGVDIGYASGSYFTKNGQSCATMSKYWSNGRCHKNGVCDDASSSKCNCMRYWPTGSPSTCQVDLKASQCFGFSRYCEWKLYGHHDGQDNSGFYTVIGRTSASSCTASHLKSNLLGVAAASHIRVGDDGHSLTIVSTSDSGITWADCNSDGYCKVLLHSDSWESFSSYIKGRSGILYVKAYSGGNSSIHTDNFSGKVDSNYLTPFKAYPAATSGNITVYNSNFIAYDISSSYISWNDLCTINEVYTNGFCKVTYPTGSGQRTEFAKTSTFITNGVTPYSYKPSTNLTTYTRSNMSNVFGSVFTTDNCKVVGKSGDKLELIYPVSGGNKLGWVTEPTAPVQSDFPTPLHGYNASPSARTTVYQSTSSMGTYYGQIFVDDYCTLDAVNVSQNWIKVTYPVSSGTKTGYVYLNEFVPDSSRLTSFYKTGVTAQTTTYRKSDMATSFGYVSVGDTITVVGKSGNKLQVIYPLDSGGYKIAWIYNTNVKKNLTKIAVTSNPSKTSYLEGDNLNTSGLVITAYYDDGSTSNVTGSCSISGYSNTPGSKTITVTYSGKTTAFSVDVKAKSLSSIEITSNPSKTSYKYGESINLSGLNVRASFNNGTTSNVTNYSVLFDESITKTAGTKNIKVSYVYSGIEKSTSFSITVSACTHNYSSTVVKAATCGETGTRRYTCSICGNTYDETIAKTSTHNFGDWTTATAATCSKDGSKTRKCTICGYADSQVIKATGHKYVDTIVAPTTKTQGYTIHTCSVCGHSYNDTYTDPIAPNIRIDFPLVKEDLTMNSKSTAYFAVTGNTDYDYTLECSYDKKIVSVTLNENENNGYYSYSVTLKPVSVGECNLKIDLVIDGVVYSTKILPITVTCDHSYRTEHFAPTETAQGYYLHTCIYCGYSYKDNYTDIVHTHSYTSKVTKAAT